MIHEIKICDILLVKLTDGRIQLSTIREIDDHGNITLHDRTYKMEKNFE